MSTTANNLAIHVAATNGAATNGAVETAGVMPFEVWLRRDIEGPLTEWVNGEVIVFMSASILHQRIVLFLATLLNLFVSRNRMGTVCLAPAVMRAVAGGPGREPDLFVIVADHLHRLEARQLDGPADLVVEVVSDDSVTRDRVEKFSEYEAAGVREYWIVDPRPDHQRADFFVLDSSGRFQSRPEDDEGCYRSSVLPGFWLQVEWLWDSDVDVAAAVDQIMA